MATIAEPLREKIIRHVLAELAAGVPISRTLGPEREEWLCSERTFWNWYYEADAEDENGLVQKVARARESGIEAKLDQAMHVAETPMIGTIKVDKMVNIGGAAVPFTEVRHEDMLGHRKLMVETYIKAAQMLKPKTYGPKLDLTSGGDKLGREVSEVDLATRLAALAAANNRSDDASD
jgi:hypothetical protein